MANPVFSASFGLFMPEMTGRVGSSRRQMAASRAAIASPFSALRCSGISFPMLHMTTLGWLRSRRTMATRSALAPLVEELAVAEARLVLAPLVERLVHHHEAHAVAQLEQLRRRRVVAGADGVHAHRLEDLELALDGAVVGGGAERPQVVVLADALERDARAVQQEPAVGGELERADAERRAVESTTRPPTLTRLSTV